MEMNAEPDHIGRLKNKKSICLAEKAAIRCSLEQSQQLDEQRTVKKMLYTQDDINLQRRINYTAYRFDTRYSPPTLEWHGQTCQTPNPKTAVLPATKKSLTRCVESGRGTTRLYVSGTEHENTVRGTEVKKITPETHVLGVSDNLQCSEIFGAAALARHAGSCFGRSSLLRKTRGSLELLCGQWESYWASM